MFSSSDAIKLGLLGADEAPALQPLLEACQECRFAAGELVLAGNVSNSSAFILLEGHLSVVLQAEGGPEVGSIKVGELVGEVSALTGNCTSAWVRAKQPARLLELPRSTLLELASRSHHFAYRLYSSNQRAQSSDAESKEFRQKAFFDQLTGLKNRAWLNQHLPELLEHQQRRDTGLQLYMVDIDHFKRFNDTWGHATGDLVLVEVGRALESVVRPGDHVVRLGGEEILVVADQITSADAALQVGERLRQAVEQRRVAVEGQTDPLQVTISIGSSRYRPGEASEVTLERADQALYRAKEAGRNRVELA